MGLHRGSHKFDGVFCIQFGRGVAQGLIGLQREFAVYDDWAGWIGQVDQAIGTLAIG